MCVVWCVRFFLQVILVMGMVLMLICAMMTSVSIAREKEKGTMEVLLVSPLKPFLIIVAKAVPYFALSILNLATILVFSVFVLDVPDRDAAVTWAEKCPATQYAVIEVRAAAAAVHDGVWSAGCPVE